MRIVVASSNKGKLEEIKELMQGFEVIPFDEVMESFEIEETGKDFQENALIKAEAVYAKLEDKDSIVISDDSGISVPLFGGEPGIYSARYAGKNAKMSENLEKLIGRLKDSETKRTEAFYTACIAIVTKDMRYTTHGWMHGEIIDELRGSGGFGYDPMFIPRGFEKTLGELDFEVKRELSHRSKALSLAKNVLKLYA